MCYSSEKHFEFRKFDRAGDFVVVLDALTYAANRENLGQSRAIRNCLSSLLLALTSLRLARASTPMYSLEDELIIEPGRSFQNYWRDLWPLRRAILHSRLA